VFEEWGCFGECGESVPIRFLRSIATPPEQRGCPDAVFVPGEVSSSEVAESPINVEREKSTASSNSRFERGCSMSARR